MNAIELIKAMCYDSNLAEFAQVVTLDEAMPVAEWLKYNFDAHQFSGERLTEGDYLCVYAVHTNDVYPFIKPEFVLERNNAEEYDEDDRFIWLWKIE